ncbi:MAG: SET domain-containing protein-lysine N-methyltransferase [Flavobacteriales bacterium]
MSKKIEQRTSKIHGNGVFATAPIKKGGTIVGYTGRLLSHDEADDIYGGADTGHTFLFILNEDWVIDANVGGSIAMWINHGCAPNCKAWVIAHKSGDLKKDKVEIEALRDIAPGEELTYDYEITVDRRMSAAEKKLWACRCGAPNCTGTMLREKPVRTKATAKAKAKPVRKRAKATA